MKKIFNWVAFTLSFIWQLPQSLIGLFMLIYFKIFGGTTLVSYKKLCFLYAAPEMRGGISLGNFAFVSTYYLKSPEVMAHEQLGHTWDSKLMGPFYLFIIGIPSILNVWFTFTNCYYSWYPEAWANRHAGLEVDEKCRLKFKDQKEDA